MEPMGVSVPGSIYIVGKSGFLTCVGKALFLFG